MNELLLELAKKAGLKFPGETLSPQEIEFAELIVRECALQCRHNDDMDRIEKHFGVEL
jgi:hypothetical protein